MGADAAAFPICGEPARGAAGLSYLLLCAYHTPHTHARSSTLITTNNRWPAHTMAHTFIQLITLNRAANILLSKRARLRCPGASPRHAKRGEERGLGDEHKNPAVGVDPRVEAAQASAGETRVALRCMNVDACVGCVHKTTSWMEQLGTAQ